MQSIEVIKEIIDKYEVFILDQWGVIHDGNKGYSHAIRCINYLKANNKKLIVISNSSKRKQSSINRLPILGFNSDLFDETEYSTKIAKIIGSNHTNLQINPKEILNNISNIVEEYDEPFSDSSQLPTFLLSKLVKKKITVCLSGDGGDEIFGGYNRYLFASKLKKIFSFSPYFLRKIISKLFLNISPRAYDSFFKIFGKSFIHHLDGMFAFAIVNLIDNEIIIARDRFGVKPLFYYYKNNATNVKLVHI